MAERQIGKEQNKQNFKNLCISVSSRILRSAGSKRLLNGAEFHVVWSVVREEEEMLNKQAYRNLQKTRKHFSLQTMR